MNATPGPRVSGRYFLPDAPELCRKVNPEAFVTSTNWIAEVGGADCTPPGMERYNCARYMTRASPMAREDRRIRHLLVGTVARKDARECPGVRCYLQDEWPDRVRLWTEQPRRL